MISLLKAEGLSLKLRQFILYAVAMADEDQEVLEQQQARSMVDLPSARNGSDAQPTGSGQHDVSGIDARQRDAPHLVTAQAARHDAFTSNSINSAAEEARQVLHDSTHADSSNSTQELLPDVLLAQRYTSAEQPTSSESNQAGSGSATEPGLFSSTEQHRQPKHSQGHDSSVFSELPQGLLSTEAGLAAMRQYLGSVGRYGPNTGALLTPMYGCGELPQAFCR